MTTIIEQPVLLKVQPACPVFGDCGGCVYQDIDYADELKIKGAHLKDLLMRELSLKEEVFAPIVGSPNPYHYRHRLDLTLLRKKEGIVIGFQKFSSRRMVSIESCAIARKEISEFVPELKKQAIEKLPENYDTANLVLRTGDDGRVVWGGIGRRSLAMKEEDYLWTSVRDKKVFYSLDTFFQANLGILPLVMDCVEELISPGPDTIFFDLYSGVGLFGICLAEKVKQVIMIEESVSSMQVAAFNVRYHQLKNVLLKTGKVEAELPCLIPAFPGKQVAIVDPPRSGLSADTIEAFQDKQFESLLYLSCHPDSLARDLKILLRQGWNIEKIVPFDFFPKTRHLETLVLLRPGQEARS